MEKKLHLEKMSRSLSKSDSRQKPSFLLRSALMITLILAFVSNVCALESSNGWYFKVTAYPLKTSIFIKPLFIIVLQKSKMQYNLLIFWII